MSADVERVASNTAPPTRVHGHEDVLGRLRRELAAGNSAQAYLLIGPPGVGKRTVAKWLGGALLCDSSDAGDRPCGSCRTCRLAERGALIDLQIAEAPLRVAAVREITHVLTLAPTEARLRVAVLPDMDRATPAAANALLKTLEEPPPHAVLVLTASDADSVLPTVRSRCRTVSLRPLPVAVAARALESDWGIDKASADSLARRSAGRLGWAVAAVEDPGIDELRRTWLDRLQAVLRSGPAGRLERVDELITAGGVDTGLAVWQDWWRDVLLVAHGEEAAAVNIDRIDELREAAQRFGVARAIEALRAIAAASRRLGHNTNEQLTLEVLMLEMPQ
ncbi:MAG: ATP-binding protein [Anaerolineae bacterium]